MDKVGLTCEYFISKVGRIFEMDGPAIADESVDAHAANVASVMVSQDKLLRGVAPDAFLYSAAIAMALLWPTEGLVIRWFVILAIVLAWGQWLAAALDAVENFALFTMLVMAPAEPWPQVAWWCAAIKFGLVIAGLLLVLAASVIQIVRRIKRED